MKSATSENRKLIQDKFQDYLGDDYKDFCKRHDMIPSTEIFITFLIDQNLIPSVLIKRYTVIKEFENLTQKTDSKKTKMVLALSDKFNIPERTVWAILNNKKR